MFYFIRTPKWLQKIYSSYTWKISSKEKILYLTFDDGPHEKATSFVLEQLKKYNAKATFFCIGKNVKSHPHLYKRILDEGHKTGNHTFDHLNGWKTNDTKYIDNIFLASQIIDSNLFRPPYGKIRKFQSRVLMKKFSSLKKNVRANLSSPFKIIMWTLLSGDFDTKISPEKCLENVLLKAQNGDIIVFHDSEKAFERMQYALPRVLEYFSAKDFHFEKLTEEKVL